MTDEHKTTLARYLQQGRDGLLWKLDGISERQARTPRTSTGLTLAGIVKHCANVEIGYFGLTFDRPWPEPDDACYVPLEAYESDLQADWYLPAEVPLADLVEFYRRVWAFADANIEELSLDAVGAPPWWGPGSEVTLHHMLVRVIDDTARHAGQADILRESIDAAIGLNPDTPNVPGDDFDWTAYVARLTTIAEGFPEQ